MRPTDYLQALGVAAAVMIVTLAFAFPMVAFYAWTVNPGQPQEVYNEAAQWIAPWSSHILGPLLFFAFNYFLAGRRPERNATHFALATIGAYLLLDAGTLPLFGVDIRTFFVWPVMVSLAAKAAGALLGARLGGRLGERVAA